MRTETHRLVAVVAVVAMLLCSASVLLSDDADAVGSGIYTIEMRTGQTLMYEPTTNLESDIVVEGSEGVLWDDEAGVMTARFLSVDTSGGLTATVKATWTSDINPDATMTAEQTILFRIYGHATIDEKYESSVALGLLGGQTAGTVVYTPTVSQAVDGTVTTVTCDIPENGYIGWDSENNRVVLIDDIPSDVEDFTLSFDIEATNSAVSEDSSLADETAVVHVTVGFGQDIEITSSDMIETYVGASQDMNTYVVTTNYDGSDLAQVTGITISQVVPSVSGLVASKGDGTVTFDPSAIDFGDRPVYPYYRDYTFVVTVEGQASDGRPVNDTKQVTLRVWPGQEFISYPTMEDVQFVRGADDPLHVDFSAVVGDADGIRFDWGDGSEIEDIPTKSDVAQSYAAGYTYQTDGRYVITVSAYNTVGENVMYYLYDTATGIWNPTDPPEDPGKPSEDDGGILDWLWLVFAVIAGILAVAALFGRNVYVAVGAAVCGIVAVATYLIL